jgi:hypothetical protein
MKRFHAAVNFVPETGRNILCRIKEFGTESPTLKLDKSLFDGIAIAGESFILEVGELFQTGNYLVASNAKVLDREVEAAQPFDMDSAVENAVHSEADSLPVEPSTTINPDDDIPF